MVGGVATLAVSAAVFLGAIFGVRSGWNMTLCTVVLGVAGAGLAAGALLVQRDPGLASWLIAPPVGATLGVVNVRLLLGSGARPRA